MSNKKNESERIFIQVSLSKKEKEKISNLAKEKHTSMSDFCRIAIFDYIRKLEHPEMFQTANLQFNPAMIDQLAKNTKKMIELQEIALEKTNILGEMNKTLNLIKKFSIKADTVVRETILNLFKAHNTLSPKEIVDKTNLDKEIVFSVITEFLDEDLIEMTSRGRFKLK